jgi:hypothetical protein
MTPPTVYVRRHESTSDYAFRDLIRAANARRHVARSQSRSSPAPSPCGLIPSESARSRQFSSRIEQHGRLRRVCGSILRVDFVLPCRGCIAKRTTCQKVCLDNGREPPTRNREECGQPMNSSYCQAFLAGHDNTPHRYLTVATRSRNAIGTRDFAVIAR